LRASRFGDLSCLLPRLLIESRALTANLQILAGKVRWGSAGKAHSISGALLGSRKSQAHLQVGSYWNLSSGGKRGSEVYERLPLAGSGEVPGKRLRAESFKLSDRVTARLIGPHSNTSCVRPIGARGMILAGVWVAFHKYISAHVKVVSCKES